MIAVFDNAVPLETVEALRRELDAGMPFAAYENDCDEHGFMRHRWKLGDPAHMPGGLQVAKDLLTHYQMHPVIAEFRDYSYRTYYNGYGDRYEAALVRYPAGGAYRWHTDHQYLKSKERRILLYVLFLTGPETGGTFQVNTEPLTNEAVAGGKLGELEVEAQITPEVGRFMLCPTWVAHRVTRTTGVREILLGHVCLGR